MRLLVDMNLSPRVSEALRNHMAMMSCSFRTTAWNEWPIRMFSPRRQQEDRVVITGDLDFGDLVASSAAQTVSVIPFRLRNMNASRVIARLEVVLPRAEAALENGAIVIVEDARERVRTLPIGS
jgi:predicted nuclease of predicted toxin-antitoxin system